MFDYFYNVIQFSVKCGNKNVHLLQTFYKPSYNSFGYFFRSLKELWTYLHGIGLNTVNLWNAIKDIAVKTIIWFDIK